MGFPHSGLALAPRRVNQISITGLLGIIGIFLKSVHDRSTQYSCASQFESYMPLLTLLYSTRRSATLLRWDRDSPEVG